MTMPESEQKLLDAELLKGETIRWSEAHTIVYHPGCVGNAIALAIGGGFAVLGIANLYYGYSLETPGAVTGWALMTLAGLVVAGFPVSAIFTKVLHRGNTSLIYAITDQRVLILQLKGKATRQTTESLLIFLPVDLAYYRSEREKSETVVRFTQACNADIRTTAGEAPFRAAFFALKGQTPSTASRLRPDEDNVQ